MDPDTITPLSIPDCPSSPVRRVLLSVLGAGAIAGGLSGLATLEPAEGRKKRKKKKKKKGSKRKCTGSVNGSASAEDEEALRVMINDFRQQNGALPPLTRQGQLDAAAATHSRDMATRCFFEHVNPDGVDPLQRMNAAGYPGIPTAENIYKGSRNLGSAAEAFAAWRDSPGHRANMLNSVVTEIGIGTALDSAGFMIWTNVFGRPRP